MEEIQRKSFGKSLAQYFKSLGILFLVGTAIVMIMFVLFPHLPAGFQAWLEKTGSFLDTHEEKLRFYLAYGLIAVFILNIMTHTLIGIYKALMSAKEEGIAALLLSRAMILAVGIAITYFIMEASFIRSAMNWYLALIAH